VDHHRIVARLLGALLLLGAGFAAGIATVRFGANPANAGDHAGATITAGHDAPDMGGGAAARRTPVVLAVDKAAPAVVNISTERTVEVQPFIFEDPFFQQFFGQFMDPRAFEPRKAKQTSLGSGLIVSPDGLVLTNRHVILRLAQIRVQLADGRTFDGQLVSLSKNYDLALIRVKTEQPLPAAVMGKSNTLMIGETAIAIGNPFGLSHTVTVGVVSALHRAIREAGYGDLIQTDAAINPGNSGGPLLNVVGQAIGINTAIYAQGQGIGFAIPIDRAREFIKEYEESLHARAGEILGTDRFGRGLTAG